VVIPSTRSCSSSAQPVPALKPPHREALAQALLREIRQNSENRVFAPGSAGLRQKI
jgi:hypothetical protein